VRHRHRLAAVVTLTLAIVALAACGGGSGSQRRGAGASTTTTTAASTTTTVAPAPPATSSRPCIAETAPAVRDYVGLTLAAAQAKARGERRIVRVVGADGVCSLVTMDYSLQRVDVYLVHGVVAAAQIG
jgi:hypothetical protein